MDPVRKLGIPDSAGITGKTPGHTVRLPAAVTYSTGGGGGGSGLDGDDEGDPTDQDRDSSSEQGGI